MTSSAFDANMHAAALIEPGQMGGLPMDLFTSLLDRWISSDHNTHTATHALQHTHCNTRTATHALQHTHCNTRTAARTAHGLLCLTTAQVELFPLSLSLSLSLSHSLYFARSCFHSHSLSVCLSPSLISTMHLLTSLRDRYRLAKMHRMP